MVMARRTDNRLRETINNIERLLNSSPSTEEALKKSTYLLLELLDGQYAFCYSCRQADNEGIPWDLLSSLTHNKLSIAEVSSQSTSHQIPEYYFNQILSGKVFLSEGPALRQLPFPSNHPIVNDCLTIPLTDAKNVHGVIFIANLPKEGRDGIISRIRPFIAAANCLMRISKNSAVKAPTHQNHEQEIAVLKNTFKVFDSLFNAVVLVDEDNIITMCNHACCSLFNLPKHDILGKSIEQYFPQGIPKLDMRLPVMSKRDSPNYVWRGIPIKRGDQSKTLIDLAQFNFNSPLGQLRGFTMDDISERLETAANYHDTLQRFQVLTNIAPVAIIQINTDWECTYANDTWCNYTQMTPDEANGTGWIKGLHPSDSARILNKLRLDTGISGEFEAEFRLQTPLGKVIWVQANACAVFNSICESDGLILTFNDITDRLNNEKRLQNIAERDQLTGLVNRAFFNDRLDIALKGVSRFGSVALLFLDLDDFKHINDTLGHDAGDTLLEQIGSRLTSALRDVDTIARIGGDEFTLILTNLDSINSAIIVADKLIDALSAPFIISKRSIYASASVGISYIDTPNQNPKVALKQADIALYKAKEAGKNQYRFYSQELDKHANLNILLRESLKDTSRDDFSIVYQPQVDARTGKIIGLEALTRWSHEDAESSAPTEEYIKIIEQSGLINEFSDWLFDKIFDDTACLLSHNLLAKDVRVSVNVSAKQFRNKELASFIYSRCISRAIDPSRITLEITESAIIDDPKLGLNILNQLSDFGFHISLDDFGTGYSSLSYLQKMPIDEVKIDRSFIKDISTSNDDKTIVLAIINLAKTMKLKIIAEGVDSEEIKNWLITQKCPHQQGFYFHKPMNKHKIEELFLPTNIKQYNHRTQNVIELKSLR